DYVDCGNDSSLDITDAITIEAWVKPEGHQDDYDRIVDKSSPYGFAFDAMSDEKLRFYSFFGGSGQGFNSVGAFTIDVWNYVVVKYNGTSGEFFINGVSAGTFTPSPAGNLGNTIANLTIGRKSDSVSYLFNGTIDEVRIYNRALTDDEIHHHYQSEFQKYNSTQYRFYDNVTNLTDGIYNYFGWANDSAGNSNYTIDYTSESPRYLTVDLTAPVLDAVTLSDPTPTKAGNVTFTLDFNETMNQSLNPTVKLNSSTVTAIGWQNATRWTGWFNFTTATGEGNYTINATGAKDAAGNTMAEDTDNWFVLDTTPPMTNATTTPDYNFGTWTNESQILVSLPCNDSSGSGCDTTYYCRGGEGCTPNIDIAGGSISFTTEGTNYLRYYSIDNAGNQENITTKTIKIDTTPPTTNATATPDYTFGTWTNESQIKVYLPCNDTPGSGCYVTKYCTGNDGCTPNIDIAGGFTPFTLQGINYLRYQSTDIIGKVETIKSKTIKIDTTEPVTNATAIISNGSNYTFDTWASPYVNVTLTYEDYPAPVGNNSGVNITLYCTNNISCTPNITYSTPVKINTSGTNHFRFLSNDTAGNTETIKNETIKIDSYPPTTIATGVKNNSENYTFGNHTPSSYVNVTLNCSDDEVDCDKILWCNDTANNCTPTTIYSVVIYITVETTTYIRFKSNDTFGNIEDTKNVSVIINKGVPNVTISSPDSKDYNVSSIDLNFTAIDPNGIDKCWYRLNNSAENVTIENCANTTIDNLTDSSHILYVYANDTGGRVGNFSVTFSVDATNPTINFTTQTTTSAGSHSQNWISANVTASDLGSGLHTINLTLYNSTGGLVQSNNSSSSPLFINFTNLQDGTYYLNATANDTVGNSNKTETRTILLDATSPVLNFTSPTEENNTVINQNWTETNITIDEINLDTFKFNWNQTNYTFYDDSLVLAMNFNNNSAIGECYDNETEILTRKEISLKELLEEISVEEIYFSSNPSSERKINLFLSSSGTFSSNRNAILSGAETSDIRTAGFGESGSKIQGSFYMNGSQRRISFNNIFNASSILKHLQNQINHNSGSPENGLSMADQRVSRDILPNQIFFHNTEDYLNRLPACSEIQEGICAENGIFYKQGWKLFSELNKDEKVLTLNPETKEKEWQLPTAYQTYNHNREMYEISLEGGSNLLVSPEHNIYGKLINQSQGLEGKLESLVVPTVPLSAFPLLW
ncbi:MAG: hypothetical protein KAU95_02660, partial [Candidatus Aenigmarchaeota archaeon]|nr:hypothetical protein [Candidatus Aenigmarchaeota archaeon]